LGNSRPPALPTHDETCPESVEQSVMRLSMEDDVTTLDWFIVESTME
jgi:hypothetical protein